MVVVLIWGGVAFRFIDSFGSKNNHVHHNETVQELNLPKFEIDSFNLHSKYRDPFFGKVYGKRKPKIYTGKKTVKVKEPIKKEPPKKQEPFPHYVYSGHVDNAKNGKRIHMINVEGKAYQVSSPQIIGRLEVTRVFNDSLEIKFNNETKIIHH